MIAAGQIWTSKMGEKAEVISYNEETKRVGFMFRGSKYNYGIKQFTRQFSNEAA